MAKNFEHIIHKNSSALVDNNPKLPTSGQLGYGEIAINYAKDKETISLKNSNNEIVTFTSDKKLDNYVTVSGFDEAIENLETQFSNFYTKQEIDDDSLVVASALNDLEEKKLDKLDFNEMLEGLETQLSDFYTKEEIDNNHLVISSSLNDLNTRLNTKQDTLVSGINIKTINNQSILGSGNITLEGGSGSGGGGDINVIESVKVNGKTNNPTNGVVDLGTVITSETTLSKGSTSGSGNAVTDISVSGHQITLTKGTTFLTQHQSIKTLNGTALTGAGNITLTGVPAFSASDNGKILGVVNGQLAWVTPTTIYKGSGTPSSSTGNDGDIYLQTS